MSEYIQHNSSVEECRFDFHGMSRRDADELIAKLVRHGSSQKSIDETRKVCDAWVKEYEEYQRKQAEDERRRIDEEKRYSIFKMITFPIVLPCAAVYCIWRGFLWLVKKVRILFRLIENKTRPE